MIFTVTFNPAIDKTAEVDQLIVGGLNRLSNVRQDAAGKGINVSKTLKSMSIGSICTGFLAGDTGEWIEKSIRELGIDTCFFWVKGQTRTNLKVLNARMDLTELNEPGPAVSEDDVDRLLNFLKESVQENDVVVLSGNVSPGVSKDIYARIIETVHGCGGKAILDADGDLFACGIKAQPDVIKPNAFELGQYFQLGCEPEAEESIELAQKLLNDHTRLVVISRGSKGSIFVTKEAGYVVDALKIDFHSAVGAGDAMVTGLARALHEGMSLEDTIDLAVALSAGACMTRGTRPADPEVVEELKKRVKKEKVYES